MLILRLQGPLVETIGCKSELDPLNSSCNLVNFSSYFDICFTNMINNEDIISVYTY